MGIIKGLYPTNTQSQFCPEFVLSAAHRCIQFVYGKGALRISIDVVVAGGVVAQAQSPSS